MPKAFPPEFRETVVAIALTSELPRAKIAADFGISESCLQRWLRLHTAQTTAQPALTTQPRRENGAVA